MQPSYKAPPNYMSHPTEHLQQQQFEQQPYPHSHLQMDGHGNNHTNNKNSRVVPGWQEKQQRRKQRKQIFGEHYNHNYRKPNQHKMYRIQENRNTEIERANRILLEKIQTIFKRSMGRRKIKDLDAEPDEGYQQHSPKHYEAKIKSHSHSTCNNLKQKNNSKIGNVHDYVIQQNTQGAKQLRKNKKQSMPSNLHRMGSLNRGIEQAKQLIRAQFEENAPSNDPEQPKAQINRNLVRLSQMEHNMVHHRKRIQTEMYNNTPDNGSHQGGQIQKQRQACQWKEKQSRHQTQASDGKAKSNNRKILLENMNTKTSPTPDISLNSTPNNISYSNSNLNLDRNGHIEQRQANVHNRKTSRAARSRQLQVQQREGRIEQREMSKIMLFKSNSVSIPCGCSMSTNCSPHPTQRKPHPNQDPLPLTLSQPAKLFKVQAYVQGYTYVLSAMSSAINENTSSQLKQLITMPYVDYQQLYRTILQYNHENIVLHLRVDAVSGLLQMEGFEGKVFSVFKYGEVNVNLDRGGTRQKDNQETNGNSEANIVIHYNKINTQIDDNFDNQSHSQTQTHNPNNGIYTNSSADTPHNLESRLSNQHQQTTSKDKPSHSNNQQPTMLDKNKRFSSSHEISIVIQPIKKQEQSQADRKTVECSFGLKQSKIECQLPTPNRQTDHKEDVQQFFEDINNPTKPSNKRGDKDKLQIGQQMLNAASSGRKKDTKPTVIAKSPYNLYDQQQYRDSEAQIIEDS